MKAIIHEGVVIKPGDVPEFYSLVPRHFIPDGIRPAKAYEYDFMDGRHPRPEEVLAIKATCEAYVWTQHRVEDLPQETVDAYITYVKGRANEAKLGVSERETLHEALDIIHQARLPRVNAVHGDLTFENIIVRRDGRLIFIDPGDPRGMFTPALDRGKLLQSYCMRWEERAWHEPRTAPEWAELIDWAFLVTHWVRLLRHWPSLPVRDGFESLRHVRSSLT